MIPQRRIIPHIVEQHAEEAAFLWLLRDQAVDAPHYDRDDLARLEERVEAHVDGLRVAGEAGFEIASAMLAANEEPGELFATALLALEAGASEAIEPLIEIAERNGEARRGFLGAIGWAPAKALKARVQAWLDDPRAFPRYLGLVACSLHRADPGRRLASYIDDPSPLVQARAARLAGEIGRQDLAAKLRGLAEGAAPEVGAWGVWSLALLGERAVVPELERLAEGGWRPALWVALGAMSLDTARSWLRQLNADAARARLLVEGLGIAGDPQAVPWLLGRMGDPALARPAGESFALISGLDLAYDDLEGEAPEGFEGAPSPDPADADVAMDPDEDLPWPDPDLCAAWWEKNSSRFPPGTRHLLGRPLDSAACEAAWSAGFQRQRRAAAYALALETPKTPLRNWRQRIKRR